MVRFSTIDTKELLTRGADEEKASSQPARATNRDNWIPTSTATTADLAGRRTVTSFIYTTNN